MGKWTWEVFVRHPGLKLWSACAMLLGLGCGGDDVTNPTSGSVEITTVTSGPEPDADGYAVTIDGGAEAGIALNGTHRREDLEPGSHSVQLVGLAPNCTVAGDNPRTVTVSAGATATVEFTVTCGPTTGSLTITASTSGPSPDADGYSITVDGGDKGTIAVSAEITLTGLAPGDHQVGLSGMAANCQAQGDNPRTVGLTAGTTGTAAFVITCVTPPPTTGSLAITTATTGSAQDPNGYSFALDGGATQSIALNATVTLSNVAAGAHAIRLSGVAAQCSVAGNNPQQVTVTAGQKATVSFVVNCGTVAPAYRATFLSERSGRAIAINTAGQIVEDMVGEGLLWQNGVIAELDGLGCCWVEVEDMNDAGQIVGGASDDESGFAFLWDPSTAMGLPSRGRESHAYGINSLGQVVGTIIYEDGLEGAFIWENGVTTEIGRRSLDDETSTFERANDINSTGAVVGRTDGHAVRWQTGIITDLGTLGGETSEAFGINSVSHVVGNSKTRSGEEHAFLWKAGVMADLGTLGGHTSRAEAINDAGQVVGSSETVGGKVHAFVWQDGVMTDLGTLGGDRSEALDINAAGLIVGATASVSGAPLRPTLWRSE